MRQVGRGTGSLIRPAFVVGITGYTNLVAEAAAAFSSHGWALLTYEASSSAWEEALATQCKHISSYNARLHKSANESRADVCVITALADPELDAVRNLDYGFQTTTHPSDETRYYEGVVSTGRSKLRIVAASAPEMGNPAAAIIASKMIHLYRPKVCALLGICAGIGAGIGDLVVGDYALHYESGKYKEGEEGEAVFHPQPRYQQASNRILAALRRFNSDHAPTILGLPATWPGDRPRESPVVHVGPVASGAAVVENSGMVANLVFRDRKLAALEMESYGFYLACSHATLPKPEFVMIKAVCDKARPPKEDRYQKYAAFLSAHYFYAFVAAELAVAGGLFS